MRAAFGFTLIRAAPSPDCALARRECQARAGTIEHRRESPDQGEAPSHQALDGSIEAAVVFLRGWRRRFPDRDRHGATCEHESSLELKPARPVAVLERPVTL